MLKLKSAAVSIRQRIAPLFGSISGGAANVGEFIIRRRTRRPDLAMCNSRISFESGRPFFVQSVR
jgi:hypothetical protein